MQTIVQRWKRTVLAGTVLAVGAWLAMPQAWAEEKEKTKTERGEKKNKPSAKELDQEKAKREAQQKAVEQRKKEEKERIAALAWKPSHKQTSVFEADITLHNFCLNIDGNLLAACGGELVATAPGKKPGEPRRTIFEPAEIRILSPEGKLLKTWPMEFKPEAVCVADDGTIFVAGAGRMAKLDQSGKVLLATNSPQVSELPPLPEPVKEDEAAKVAREKKVEQLEAKVKKAQEAYRKARREAKLPEDEDVADELGDRSTAAQVLLIKEPMEKLTAAQQELEKASISPEMLVMRKREEIREKAAVNGIAVTKGDVFVACRMAKTYGFAVWRVDRDFANAKKIIEGLRGCCGQMDIQAKDGEVWVAHNAAHKVERYDRDGKKLSSFGKSDSKAADGFGGCCEPKNLRFGPKGELYTSESSPQVVIKRFAPDGKFLGVVGLPAYSTGCTNVPIEVSRDGRQVYILNPNKKVHVLTKRPAEPAKTGESEKKEQPAK